MICFEWDPRKARGNLAKHGVSFEEAMTVFQDEFATQYFDLGNSIREDRFLMLGVSDRGRVLLVCHTEREGVVRIISARRATPSERMHYRGQLQ